MSTITKVEIADSNWSTFKNYPKNKQKLRPNGGGQHYDISFSTLPEPISPKKSVEHFPTVEMAL